MGCVYFNLEKRLYISGMNGCVYFILKKRLYISGMNGMCIL